MEIKKLIQIRKIKIDSKSIKFTKRTRLWCQLPYPDHPKGCPNYNKNPNCPPLAKFMKKILIEYLHFYLIYAEFDLKIQKERMLSLHPNWSNRQANCLLYWQNSVKKELKNHIKKIFIMNNNSDLFLLSCGSGFNSNDYNQETVCSMEAAGIDVFNTLKNNNISFEIKPKNKVLLITLLCSNEKLLV